MSARKILTFGTFDHLHPGHIAYLEEAGSMGDLFVVIARDSHVEAIKGITPDHHEKKRLQAVQEAFPDATVLLGDTDDYLVPVRAIAPDLIVMGYDQKLPPGISAADLPCPIQKAAPFAPEKHKSSIMRQQ